MQGFSISWAGRDEGPAGLKGYEVQYRDGAGPWTAWLTDTLQTSAPFTGTGGHRYGFRARAWDAAYNYQPWRSQPDAETTFYTWQVGGFVWDVRHIPLSGTLVQASPAPLFPIAADMYGHYQAYMTGQSRNELGVSRAGYGSPLPMVLDLQADTTAHHVLPSTENLVQDGGFESGSLSPAWQAFGNPLPSVNTTLGHTGGETAAVGQPFGLTEPQTPFQMQMPRIAVDNDRMAHVVGVSRTVGIGFNLVYAKKPLTGTWPVTPTTLMSGRYSEEYSDIVPDGEGGAHVVWMKIDPVENIFHCHVPAAGDGCATLTKVTNYDRTYSPSPDLPRLAADYQGGLHLIWRGSSASVWYQYRPPGGAWTDPVRIVEQDASGFEIGVDGTGTAHVVWGGWSITYRYKPLGGTWSASEKVGDDEAIPREPVMAVGKDGTVHVAWCSARCLYTARTPSGVWSAPTLLPLTEMWARSGALAVDGLGGVHAALWANGSLIYVAKPLGSAVWRRLAVVPAKVWIDLAVDYLGAIHTVWSEGPVNYPSNLSYTRSLISEADADFGLSQSISIPAAMHAPTLSLLYRSDGKASARNPLTISVNDGQNTTQVKTATVENTEWAHLWADMTPWAGKTVTVTITLRQLAGNPISQAYLDDITLGPWLTPLIHWVEPANIPPNVPFTITIFGQNFMPTPSLRVNNMPLTNVQRANPYILQATLPPGLGIGTYDLWVTNPGGQEGRGLAKLHVGRRMYLPSVMKKARG